MPSTSCIVAQVETREAVPGHSRGCGMRTLVLNAGYEPLAIVSFKRAIVLVLNDKADGAARIPEA